MRCSRFASILVLLAVPASLMADSFLDSLDDVLAASSANDVFRARLSGTLDLEGYRYQQPAPSLIVSSSDTLFNPRLSLFLDAQLGEHVYAFVQSRVDRGFDPGDRISEMRLDEYALRLTPWDDGRLNLQVGKFATVVGTWTLRHASWDNPLITAPLLYENLTGVWDAEPVPSASVLRLWANAGPNPSTAFPNKSRSMPIIWGPSYATGASVSGALGEIEYAAEVKNASLSSRPDVWSLTQKQFQHPTWSGRVGFTPDAAWHFGVSTSAGAYLRPSAAPFIPAGYGFDDYREIVLAQDASFAWHHIQVWEEFYDARFEIPRVGQAGTLAGYVETKVKLTPRLFGALRWNRQIFGTLPAANGTPLPWGSNAWRIDAGPGYRFTPRTQLKIQASYLHEQASLRDNSTLLAAQFTVRF